MFQKQKIKKMVLFVLLFCLFTGAFAVKTEAAATAGSKAEEIIKKNVKKGVSNKKKLKKLFTYVEKNYDFGRAMGFKTYMGW